MTEAEWLGVADPDRMWGAFDARSLQRKVFLWSAACCDRAGHLLWEPTQRLIQEVVTWAETEPTAGLPPASQFMAVMDMYQATPQLPARDANRAVTALINGSCASVARGLATALAGERTGGIVPTTGHEPPTEWVAARQAERASQAMMLRDIIGNPFRPVAFQLAWRTGTALTLARQMYESRDFSAMPILADALQDAGCVNPDILDHCRGDEPHVRGCWVVDLVLGKV